MYSLFDFSCLEKMAIGGMFWPVLVTILNNNNMHCYAVVITDAIHQGHSLTGVFWWEIG
jgi:hypothetical protein